MACTLATRHDVTVATVGGKEEIREGIRIVPAVRAAIVREARRTDAVLAPRLPPYLFAALVGTTPLIVADLYNPFDAERSELMDSAVVRRQVATAQVGHRLQLRFADLILCAVDAQREALLDDLARVPARRGPEPPVEVVRFGIPDPPPSSDLRPLRKRFPQIGTEDVVVLWWGNVWRWFDADTAIRATAQIARRRPEVKLVLTAGRSPRGDWPQLTATDAARALAADLGLLDKTVFFLDEWVAQHDRHHYLAEADIGLTLARDTAETTVAARGRYMDYLWSALPCVLGAGDELADRFADAGFALTVPPGDLETAVSKLEALICDPRARERARQAGRALAPAYHWSATVQPLLERLEELGGLHPELARALPAVAPALTEYYARRLWQRVAQARAANFRATLGI